MPSFERSLGVYRSKAHRSSIQNQSTMGPGCLGTDEECSALHEALIAFIRPHPRQQAIDSAYTTHVQPFEGRYELDDSQRNCAISISMETGVSPETFAVEMPDTSSLTTEEKFARDCWKQGSCGNKSCPDTSHFPGGFDFLPRK